MYQVKHCSMYQQIHHLMFQPIRCLVMSQLIVDRLFDVSADTAFAVSSDTSIDVWTSTAVDVSTETLFDVSADTSFDISVDTSFQVSVCTSFTNVSGIICLLSIIYLLPVDDASNRECGIGMSFIVVFVRKKKKSWRQDEYNVQHGHVSPLTSPILWLWSRCIYCHLHLRCMEPKHSHEQYAYNNALTRWAPPCLWLLIVVVSFNWRPLYFNHDNDGWKVILIPCRFAADWWSSCCSCLWE